MTKKAIATRLDPAMIAKARDGLIVKGFDLEQLMTVSNIVRLTFFYGLADLVDEPTSLASEESMAWVAQRVKQGTRKKNLKLEDLLK